MGARKLPRFLAAERAISPARSAEHALIPVTRARLEHCPSAPPTRVLVVDERDEFGCCLTAHLTTHGLDAVACNSGQAALDLITAGTSPDIIVLDGHKPEANNPQTLRELRQRGITPVILLTGPAHEASLSDPIKGSVGESDQLSILARCIRRVAEAVCGIAEHPPQEELQVLQTGSMELRFDIQRARWAGQVIEFTLTEFNMVSRLAMKPGEDISYRALYDIVRGKGFVAGRDGTGYRTNVRGFIKRIRKKFREVYPPFNQIQNYQRFGYRWVPE